MRKDILGLDDEVSSQDSHAMSKPDQEDNTFVDVEANTPSLPRAGVVSEFDSSYMVDTALRSYLQEIWRNIRSKISRTPIDSLSSIEEGIRYGLSRMKEVKHNFDLSCVENSLETLFANAKAYDQAKSKSRMLGENSAQEFQKAKAFLHNLRLKEKEDISHIKPIEKELAEMKKRKKELTLALMEHQTSLDIIRGEIKEVEEKVNHFKNTPLVDGKALEDLKNSQNLLEFAQKALEDQDPFI